MKYFILRGFVCKAVNMKHIFSLFIIFIICENCFATIKTWTGLANDGLWSTALNWSGNTIPLSTDDVLLGNSVTHGSYTVALASTSTTVFINSLTISPTSGNTVQLTIPISNTANPGLNITGIGDALLLNSGAILLNSTGVGNVGVGLAITNAFRINNGAKYIHNNVRANASIVSQLSSVSGTENGIFEFDVPATGSYSISFSNLTYGTLILSSVASGGNRTYFCTGTNTAIINGDLEINSGVIFNMQISGTSGNIIVNGNYIQNGGTLNLASTTGNSSIVFVKGNLTQVASGIITETNTGTRAIELDGTSQQTVSLQGTITNNITFRMNNSAGAILASPLFLSYKLELLNGKIITSSTNLLTLQSGCTISVDSTNANTSYVDGPLRKEGLFSYPYFLFPVGKSGKMCWLELKNAIGNFTVEFIKDNPRNLSTTYSSGIDHVGTNYYWNIDADVSPSASANVELSFPDVFSSGVTDMSALRVAQLIGNTWVNENNIATTGSAGASGSVVSATINTFNSAARSFALASNTNNQNPLPITFTSFTVTKLNYNSALLVWQIASDQIDHFEVQSSTDNINFNFVEKIQSVENENIYQFTDEHLSNGIIYYRVKVIAKTGEENFSKIIAVSNSSSFSFHIISLTPQNANNILMIHLTSSLNTTVQFIFYSMDGNMVKKNFEQVETGDNNITLNISGMSSGMYILQAIDAKGNSQTARFIKQ
jgi:hypothetical protein